MKEIFQELSVVACESLLWMEFHKNKYIILIVDSRISADETLVPTYKLKDALDRH